MRDEIKRGGKSNKLGRTVEDRARTKQSSAILGN